MFFGVTSIDRQLPLNNRLVSAKAARFLMYL
jgi:hypothetical protein